MNYADIDAMNWSTLKHMDVSPKYFQYRLRHPVPRKLAYLIGNGSHCHVLERDDFGNRYAVCDVVRNAKQTPYKEWLALNAGKEALKPAEMAAIRAMSHAVDSHPEARKLLTGGRAEEVVQWVDPITGIKCKGRLDYIQPDKFTDYKTTRRLEQRGFEYDCADFLYHGQMAFYHDGAIAAGVLPKDAQLPHIVAVDKPPPKEVQWEHDVTVYVMSWEAFEAGRELYRRLLRRYVECTEAGIWPGMAPGLRELGLPRRARVAEDDGNPFE